MAITNAGDGSGRLFVVEQVGAVRIVRNGAVAAQPFLNISSLVTAGGEQDTREEIGFQPAGSGAGVNYGWNVMEGSLCFLTPSCSSAGLTLPVVEYDHGNGDCSVTGGYVYRGSSPALRGAYLYGDFCSGRIWGLRHNGVAWENRLLLDSSLLISTFGEDESGELYVADYAAGAIFRISTP